MRSNNYLYVFLAGILLLASCHETEGVVGVDPCGTTERSTSVCLADGEACQDDNDCCTGLGCFGYNFFKRCQAPPVCLKEYQDCGTGIICCGKLVCSLTNGGKMECQKEKIGTRPVFNPGNLVSTAAPTAAPKPRNTKTTKISGTKVTYNVGCVSGDPHVTTFDGYQYDCQTHGEHILVKSTVTQREIQGRFKQLEGRTASVIQGVVIQDEGDTPKVQVSMPVVDEGISHVMSPEGCRVQLFVDNVQQDLFKYNGSAVSVVVKGNNTITVKYKVSEMIVKLTVAYWNGCYITVCPSIPTTDTVIGLLGNPDKNVTNDWMARDGTTLPQPVDPAEKSRSTAYNYCSKNWCMRDKTESLFYYNQLGLSFEDFQRCDLKYAKVLTEKVSDLLADEIKKVCQGDSICAIDAATGGLAGAVASLQARQELKRTCNPPGGECDVSSCCDGLICEDRGMAGNVCVTAQSSCMPEMAPCDTTPCCEGKMCVNTTGAGKICQAIPGVCTAEYRSCTADKECCSGLSCIGPDGDMYCKRISILATGEKCLPKNEQCGFDMNCCPGSVCTDDLVAGYRCLTLPQCWDKPMRPCDDLEGLPGCCDGLECIERTGRNVCAPVPQCMSKYLSCDKVPCCATDGTFPLQCVSTTTGGVTRKICQPDRTSAKPVDS